MKFRKILAALLMMIIVATLAGCNYISRPYGAANNGQDISDKLSSLLIIPTFTYEDPPEEVQDNPIYVPSDQNDPEPEPEPEPEPDPDPVYTPFTSEYDANALLSKIDELVKTMKTARGVANSATGVSDELLANRSIKILVPDNFPIDEENAAVQALTSQYGCAVNVRRVGTGSAYTAACRRAALSGDKVDLMYVDNAIWGDIHSYTQPINSFVNFDLGDQMNTFSSVFSKKFNVPDALDETILHYYVAAGMGAPYLLVYNKANIKSATLQASTIEDPTEGTIALREIAVDDPVAMYNNRTWGIGAFTAMLQASTGGENVGLASQIDYLKGLDIWYGMENCGGFTLSSTTGKSTVNITEAVNKNIDAVQNWYWNTKGLDAKNFVGSLLNASAWADGSVYQKLFNRYSGTDSVRSFSFVACEPGELAAVSSAADSMGGEWDFVAYPYGETYENTYRALSAEDFTSKVTADQETAGDANFEKEIVTPVAGWVGGFAVMKSCQNPSVALRIAEEYTKIWKDTYENSYYQQMTEEQQARYKDMKENIGVSFVRGWAEKAADVNAVYPDASQYFYGFNSVGGTITSEDPDYYATERSNYLALTFFDNNALLVTQPMYHKNDIMGIYNPSVQTTWSAFMDGAPSSASETAKDTGSVIDILNTTLLPSTVLFNW